jgi:hypothetical protein
MASDVQALLQPQDTPSLVVDEFNGLKAAAIAAGETLTLPLTLLSKFITPAGIAYEFKLTLKEEPDGSFGAYTDAGVKVTGGAALMDMAIDALVAIAGVEAVGVTSGAIAIIGGGVVIAAALIKGAESLFNISSEVNSLAGPGITYLQASVINIQNDGGQLTSKTEVDTDGSKIVTNFNQLGGSLISTVNHYDPTGKLVRVDEVFPLGKSISFDTGTYNNLSYNPSTGSISANLTTASGSYNGINHQPWAGFLMAA